MQMDTNNVGFSPSRQVASYSHPQSSERELYLLKRIQEAEEKLTSAHSLIQQLKATSLEKEKEMKTKILQQDKDLFELNKENYVLQTQLNHRENLNKETKWSNNWEKIPADGEMLKEIQKEVQNQEMLLQGYQQAEASGIGPKKSSKKALSERARSPEPCKKASKRHHSSERESPRAKEPAANKSRVQPEKSRDRHELEAELVPPSRSRSPSPVPGPSSAVSIPPALKVVSPPCPSVRALISESKSEGEIREEVLLLVPEPSAPSKDSATLGAEADEVPLDPETEKILRDNPDLIFDSLTGRFLQHVDPRVLMPRLSMLPLQSQIHGSSPSPLRVLPHHPRHRSPSRRLSRSRSASPVAPPPRYLQAKHHWDHSRSRAVPAEARRKDVNVYCQYLYESSRMKHSLDHNELQVHLNIGFLLVDQAL
ncbi:hypothetical protein JD844_024132 [Phrynosoma platyrhinos]|uniref:Centrosomal protein of 162 kDa n=1 Tax=Phrynosoma platyrhinos TaxID=52577 RepID=A0ABQ7SYI4_PHRPL|nr:hypothetical protein JD844_024132 [Phrynosoma platyrhinos]